MKIIREFDITTTFSTGREDNSERRDKSEDR